jgi:hypothetical protein
VKDAGPLEATVLASSGETMLEGGITLESLFEPTVRVSTGVEDIDFDDCPPKYPEQRFDLACGECKAPMQLRNSKTGPFYGCSRYPECLGTHGAYPSGKPKGIPGNKDTRMARIAAHKVFDQIWKDRLVKHRGAAYNWMRQVMGLTRDEAHIGMFDIERCEKLVRLVYRDYPSLMGRYEQLLYGEDPFEDP